MPTDKDSDGQDGTGQTFTGGYFLVAKKSSVDGSFLDTQPVHPL